MKKYDVVKLMKLSQKSIENNLYEGAIGVVIENEGTNLKVLFCNQYNEGDYAFVMVSENDLKVLNDNVDSEIRDFFSEKLSKFNLKEKGFKTKNYNAYDVVELLVDKYESCGVYKGDVGVIMDDVAVNDCVLVDFGRLDENNNFLGDCVLVNTKDIRVLK